VRGGAVRRRRGRRAGGQATEFHDAAQIRDRYGVLREIVGGGWLKLSPGQVTDDTDMTFASQGESSDRTMGSRARIADRFAPLAVRGTRERGPRCRPRGSEEYIGNDGLKRPRRAEGGKRAGDAGAPVAALHARGRGLLSRFAVAQAHINHHHRSPTRACVSVER